MEGVVWDRRSARFIQDEVLRTHAMMQPRRGPAKKPPRRVGEGGATTNVVAFAIVTQAAGASQHTSTGIQPGTTGEAELLDASGDRSGGEVIEFKSAHRVQCRVGAYVTLSAPTAIEAGSTWPDDPNDPQEGEAAVWGQYVDVADYLREEQGFGPKKTLAVPDVANPTATDIQWMGGECNQGQ